jgi:hypothetical protein
MPHPIGFSLIIKHIGSTGGAHFVMENDIAHDACETFTNTWSWNPDDGVALGSSRLGVPRIATFSRGRLDRRLDRVREAVMKSVSMGKNGMRGVPQECGCSTVRKYYQGPPASGTFLSALWISLHCSCSAFRGDRTRSERNALPNRRVLGVSLDGMVNVTVP